MAKTPSAPSSGFDAGALRQKICEKIKTHRGKPEDLTTVVAKIIVREGLGLADKQIAEQYWCFWDLRDAKNGRADLAITYEDTDLNTTKENPKILFELKRRDRKFNYGSKSYFEDVDQLKGYMNSKPCQTVEHGIIFNIDQLQIFRKHGNLIFSIKEVIDFPDFNDQSQQAVEKIEMIINFLKGEIIEQPRKDQRLPGTIITVWNNKGGVGKTTTVSYLSLLLSMINCPRKKVRRNRVIAIDFDHNQANLTKRFECEKTDGKTEKLLDHLRRYENLDLFELKGYFEEIKCKKQRTVIDFLPADQNLSKFGQEAAYGLSEENHLRRLCIELAKKYDYIIIDTPPGWEQNLYAQSAVTAADCLLPIGSYGDFDSFYGYYSIICDKLPAIRKDKPDMVPNNLGLWINNWRPSDKGAIKRMNSKEFEHYIKITQKEKQEEVRRSFFDIHKQKDDQLRRINFSAWIAKGSCHNPDMKVDLLKTFDHNDIRKAYYNLLTSIVGEIY